MRTSNIPNIIASGTVMNAAINSAALPLYQAFGYAIQIVFTGTPNGVFSLQGSCDPVPQAGSPGITAVPTPENWTTIANSSQTVTVAGSVVFNVSDSMYNWVRAVYTDSSGGTSTAIITVSTANIKSI